MIWVSTLFLPIKLKYSGTVDPQITNFYLLILLLLIFLNDSIYTFYACHALFYPVHACCSQFSHFIDFFDRVQKNFEGRLIGADRTKDLAVLKVCLFVLIRNTNITWTSITQVMI